MIEKGVIPAKAGIQKSAGFRVKPGMTNCIRFISPGSPKILCRERLPVR